VGSAIAAQLAERMRRDLPTLDEQITIGDFSGLRGWLRESIYSKGARLPLAELMEATTGKPLGATAALRYLERKYLETAA
jgi:carboxypeptidase Taq